MASVNSAFTITHLTNTTFFFNQSVFFNLLLQVSILCGIQNSSSLFMCLNWLWCGLWWRTMMLLYRMIWLACTLSLSPAWRMVSRWKISEKWLSVVQLLWICSSPIFCLQDTVMCLCSQREEASFLQRDCLYTSWFLMLKRLQRSSQSSQCQSVQITEKDNQLNSHMRTLSRIRFGLPFPMCLAVYQLALLTAWVPKCTLKFFVELVDVVQFRSWGKKSLLGLCWICSQKYIYIYLSTNIIYNTQHSTHSLSFFLPWINIV